jgi:hypothetical protein
MSSISLEQKYTRFFDSIVNGIPIEMYSKHGNTLYFHFFHMLLCLIMELFKYFSYFYKHSFSCVKN